MSNPIIPSCCITIVKDMVSSASKNSALIRQLLLNCISPSKKFQIETELPKLKENNNIIIGSLKSLCEILIEHNRKFLQSSSEPTLNTIIQSQEEINVHSIINVVTELFKSSLPPICKVYTSIVSALDSSVIFRILIVECFKADYD